jgi:dihydrofolate synthase/folylpolyglutamate synthase
MNYQQTLDYLFSRFPTFHLIGASAYKANLDNTFEICSLTNNPHLNFKAVHIAGTNGKGSVSHILASILQESGYKTALFTSPHLKDFRERIKVNGEMVTEEFVCGFVEKYKAEFERIEPSFFEMSFGLAMSWFDLQNVDIAVIETGMGGRLDSTNVINPVLSVITNIGLDHTQFLGNTITEIAREKGGIIKPGIPVIIGETHAESSWVFEEIALLNKSTISFADQEVNIQKDILNTDPALLKAIVKSKDQQLLVECPLAGEYQLKNLATVYASALKLETILEKPNGLNIQSGIRNTIKNTSLMGRWQTLRVKPLTICDIGHNPQGFQMVVEQLKSMKYRKLHFVIGVVNDKDIRSMLAMLPKEATYYFCKAAIPRGLEAIKLQTEATAFDLKGEAYHSVRKALDAAWKAAEDKDMVFIGGSAFTVAEII